MGGSNTNLILFDQKLYQTEVEPALKIYLNIGDTERLMPLIARALTLLRSKKIESRWGGTDIEFLDAAQALLSGKPGFEEHLVLDNGEQKFSRTEAIKNMVRTFLSQALLNALCLVRENHQILELNIWDSRIASHLYAKSAWIKDKFWGMTPEVDYAFEFSTYGGSGPLPVWFAHEFDAELMQIPSVPGGEEAKKELSILKRMVHLSCINPSFRLVLEY